MDLVVQKLVSLSPKTTFKVGGVAAEFIEIIDIRQLPGLFSLLKRPSVPHFFLSGGSNVVISDEGLDGVVVSPNLVGVNILKETKSSITLKVAGGEVWDDFVSYAALENWWGIENLSHIPGLVGSVPVQNVAAYGQEVSDVITEVEVFDLKSGRFMTLLNQECHFSYRNSRFKSEKNLLITSVTFNLSKVPKPSTSYKDLSLKFGKSIPSISEIRKAIIEIRNSKYPFPLKAKNGNAGSFFKNIEVTNGEAEIILKKVKRLLGKPKSDFLREVGMKKQEGGVIKFHTAALIDISNLKSYKVGGAYVHPTQPLVLMNDGKARAQDIYNLCQLIISEVKKNSGLVITPEPEFVGKFNYDK